MRVLCSTLDGSELEGKVIGGDYCDEVSGEVDLAETLRQCDPLSLALAYQVALNWATAPITLSRRCAIASLPR